MCKELLHTKGNCLPKIKNEKAFTPCGQAAKIIADIVSAPRGTAMLCSGVSTGLLPRFAHVYLSH